MQEEVAKNRNSRCSNRKNAHKMYKKVMCLHILMGRQNVLRDMNWKGSHFALETCAENKANRC
jgi:hypothetical protein